MSDRLLRRPDAGGEGPAPPLREAAGHTAAPAMMQAPARPARRWGRRLALLALPLLAAAAALYAYLAGGGTVGTDNAYVKADIVYLSTDVPGMVAAVEVEDNQPVRAGDTLFRLDDEPFRIALEAARAELGTARNEIATLQAAHRQSQAQLDQARTDLAYYQTSFERQRDLIRRGATTQAAYDQAKRELDAARQGVVIAQRLTEAALARLGGSAEEPIEAHPRFRKAQADVDKAARDLRRVVVAAPADGIVTRVPALQVGAYLEAGVPAFSLVAAGRAWVEANMKETDLDGVAVGAAARVTIDSYPGRVWQGRVASVSPASGAEFAVLPPQNASANWVKVVQRVPVRIELEPLAGAPPLRAGMSADVAIETGRRRSLGGLLGEIRRAAGL
ncbi:MAG: hypothetical protein OHK0024_06120 [Thalassobaculales bacterium]